MPRFETHVASAIRACALMVGFRVAAFFRVARVAQVFRDQVHRPPALRACAGFRGGVCVLIACAAHVQRVQCPLLSAFGAGAGVMAVGVFQTHVTQPPFVIGVVVVCGLVRRTRWEGFAHLGKGDAAQLRNGPPGPACLVGLPSFTT